LMLERTVWREPGIAQHPSHLLSHGIITNRFVHFFACT